MIVAQDEPTAGRQLVYGAARSREFRSSRSIEACLMAEVAEPLIYWSVGIAIGGWLFFEIAKRM
jgi:hypothetical protein